MKDRLLVVAASGEVLEGARIFPHEVASNERGAKRERGARSSNDPISFPTGGIRSPLDGLWTPLRRCGYADPHKISGSLPEEQQLTEMVEFVAYVSGEPMACYAGRN